MNNVKVYLEINMVIKEKNREAAKVYYDYRKPFLNSIKGAFTKDLLVRTKMSKYYMDSIQLKC